MAHEIPVTQARAEFAELINRVVYGGERVVVTRHGKPLIALVSADDLAFLEASEQGERDASVASVAALPEAPSAAGERPRFGIAAHYAAEHRPPGVTDR